MATPDNCYNLLIGSSKLIQLPESWQKDLSMISIG